MYFNDFKSSRPFITLSWDLDPISCALGVRVPSGTENHVWAVFFDPNKIKEAKLDDADNFRKVVDLSLQHLNELLILDGFAYTFDIRIAPLTRIEANRIWAGAPCGYEQVWLDQASTDPQFCNRRFDSRLLLTEFNFYQSLAVVSRQVRDEKKSLSNKILGEALVDQINKSIGIEVASLSSGGYTSEPSYGYY